jgi:hypothetical protein
MHVEGSSCRNDGYDPSQREYVVTRTAAQAPARLTLTFEASDASPVVDPAIVIRNWGEGMARLEIDGKSAPWGKDFRMGYVHRLDGTDLVIWIQRQSTQPIHLQLTPIRLSTAR